MKAVGIVVLAVILMGLLVWQQPMVAAVLIFGFYIAMPICIGAIIYSITRYRLTRTRWRGIRFGLQGSAFNYGAQVLGYGLLTGMTLGIYKPYMNMNLACTMLNNMYFGDQRFTFSGTGSDLIGRYMIFYGLVVAAIVSIFFAFVDPMALLVTLLLAVAAMVAWFWYNAEELRYQVSKLRMNDVEFALEASNWQMAGLFITNFLLLVFTLGLAYPWVLVRTARFMAGHLAVIGDLDYAAILQAQTEADATGEGMAEVFDVGLV
ncbi:YjgN family protein [Alkalilimnicola ehrlichii]|uniref:YjgN family protein n=1 Tax=Alkalilimnicola ehrlichii TaxID=351052 RepID=UPI0015F26694|nr:DUF898 family protein [Alkalilimnicola ehrlichii]